MEGRGVRVLPSISSLVRDWLHLVGVTAAAAEEHENASDYEDDDSWDDDRYSMEYGITEQLDPEFWHPLRIAGIVMFILTLLSLVALARMSRRRLKRREEERKLAKEQSGLLNNPPPGLDELVALGNVLDDDDTTREYDVVVVDTAPTGHTLRLLQLPQFLDGLLGKLIKLRMKLSGMLSLDTPNPCHLTI